MVETQVDDGSKIIVHAPSHPPTECRGTAQQQRAWPAGASVLPKAEKNQEEEVCDKHEVIFSSTDGQEMKTKIPLRP